VWAGDEDVVRNVLGLRVGSDELGLAVSFGGEIADGTLRSVVLDIGRRAGWRAYQRFALAGRLPPSGHRGVEDAALGTTMSYADTSELRALIHGTSVGMSLSDSGGEVLRLRHADGRRVTSWITRVRDVTLFSTRVARPGRRPRNRYSLFLKDVDPSVLEIFERDVHGRDLDVDSDRDVRLDFTGSGLMRLRDQALIQIADASRSAGDDLTPAEVAWIMDEHPEFGIPGPVFSPTVGTIARADRPAGVYNAIFRNAWGDPDRLLLFLQGFGAATTTARYDPSDETWTHPDAVPPVRLMVLGGQIGLR
jgi:hypothetical protein